MSRWRGRRDVDGPNHQSELSQLLRNAGIKTPTCAILWREYADAAAVAQHIRVVKQIDDVEAERNRLKLRRPLDVARDAEIDHGIGRVAERIRCNAVGQVAGAQAAAVNQTR